jgi:hypothetical protein
LAVIQREAKDLLSIVAGARSSHRREILRRVRRNFTSGRSFGFAWSRDGKNLDLAKGEIQNDVVPISKFR